MLGVGIIKSALVQDWKPGDKVTGDAIKAAIDDEANPNRDVKWEEYIVSREVPPARQQVPNAPTVALTDLSVSRPNDDGFGGGFGSGGFGTS